jgi:hypothetical protein
MHILFSTALICLLAVACSDQTTVVESQPSPGSLPAPALAPAVEPATQPVVSPTAEEPLSPTTAAASFLCPGDARPDEAWQCREDSGDGVRRCTGAAPDRKLHCYEDLDYRFAVSLPAGSSAASTGVLQEPQFGGAMIKRHLIQHAQGHTDLVVLLAGGQELDTWLITKQGRNPLMFPVTEPNAAVSAQPAVIWFNCSGDLTLIDAVVSDGEHVYWWRHVAYYPGGVLLLRQMLDSVRFSSEAPVPADIPEQIWQQAQAACSNRRGAGEQPAAAGPSLLFAAYDDVWQADLDGQEVRQVTPGGFLNWGMDDELGNWYQAYLHRPLQVAPDGRHLIHSRTGRDLLLFRWDRLDVPEALPPPGAPRVAWSPDSRYLAYAPDAGVPAPQAGLYLYSLDTGAAQHLLSAAEASDIAEIVWSPDGRFLAFACCYAPAEDSESAVGVEPGLIRRLEVATGALETVAETTRSVGGGTARLCWTSDGEVAEEGDVAPYAMVRCSYQRPGPIARSADGRYQAILAPLSPDDQFWTGSSRLTVTNTETGEVQWQLDLEINASRIFWSPDGQWLYLDNLQAYSPIWRLPAGSRGELEVIIERGFLLAIVAPEVE